MGDRGNSFRVNLIHHKTALPQKAVALCSPPRPHQCPAPRATPRAGKQTIWASTMADLGQHHDRGRALAPVSMALRGCPCPPGRGGTSSRGRGGGAPPIQWQGRPLPGLNSSRNQDTHFKSPKPMKETDQCCCCISSKLQSSQISQTILPPESD